MSRVIAIANGKGGVGKTLTTINLAGEYAFQGKRVLVIDIDRQASLTHFFLEQLLDDSGNVPSPTLYNVLAREVPLADVIRPTPFKQLFVAPAHERLRHMSMELNERGADGIYTLREAIQALTASGTAFDYILIDTPGEVGALTKNALAAADIVVCPVHPKDEITMASLPSCIELVNSVKRDYHQDLQVAGWLINNIDSRVRKQSDAERQVRDMGFPALETVIPGRVVISAAVNEGKPIQFYRKNDIAELYTRVINELEHAYVS